MAERRGLGFLRPGVRMTRRQERRARRARKKVEKLQRKIDKAKIKGKHVRVAKLQRKQKLAAAKGGISTRRAPGVPRRAPRHKYRIRKGQKQEWSMKYRGWVPVPRRRRGVTRGIREEIDDLKQTLESLKSLIMVIPR